MTPIMFDIEADGLLEDVTRIHCLVGRNLLTDEVNRFYRFDEFSDHSKKDAELDRLVEYIDSATTLVGHNIVGYDLDLLERFYGMNFDSGINILDTLVWSQALYPDRQLPRGCPPVIVNPVTGIAKKVGPHSVEAWGYRVAKKKPQIDDWRFFNRSVLHRCEEDVGIQTKIFYALLKEANLTMEDVVQ